ncbi:hypothetical protein BX661DRAFT_186395 [Kickxella alabastrina]|uniref:uncharacterized protein n=1 Tax=Kickxella alabastrina TaxID=61397 RepID=UPI002221290C|nr:uncharacterized protein BX661DRAFT_186395 [Kickxella alabastrina]KAI7823759.1 hypothetical protein BX661DRAFT_186395 [Kickxella alabastrina]
MSSKVFVGSLPFSVSQEELTEIFSKFGAVLQTVIVNDRETGRSRGFGFVTFGTPEEAQAAIEGGTDMDVQGRKIVVNAANERDPSAPRPQFQSRGSYNNNGQQRTYGDRPPRRNYEDGQQQQEGGSYQQRSNYGGGYQQRTNYQQQEGGSYPQRSNYGGGYQQRTNQGGYQQRSSQGGYQQRSNYQQQDGDSYQQQEGAYQQQEAGDQM